MQTAGKPSHTTLTWGEKAGQHETTEQQGQGCRAAQRLQEGQDSRAVPCGAGCAEEGCRAGEDVSPGVNKLCRSLGAPAPRGEHRPPLCSPTALCWVGRGLELERTPRPRPPGQLYSQRPPTAAGKAPCPVTPACATLSYGMRLSATRRGLGKPSGKDRGKPSIPIPGSLIVNQYWNGCPSPEKGRKNSHRRAGARTQQDTAAVWEAGALEKLPSLHQAHRAASSQHFQQTSPCHHDRGANTKAQPTGREDSVNRNALTSPGTWQWEHAAISPRLWQLRRALRPAEHELCLPPNMNAACLCRSAPDDQRSSTRIQTQ